MNAFYEHHKDSIRFGYRCFSRTLTTMAYWPIIASMTKTLFSSAASLTPRITSGCDILKLLAGAGLLVYVLLGSVDHSSNSLMIDSAKLANS
jgi:hypothetical protein